MSQEKRFQVFVSSTFRDLREERQAALKAVLQMKHMPAGMELFPASDDTAWKLIQDVINASDYYVLIIGGRYGSQDEEGIGFTEKEYDYAKKRKKPIIALLRNNPYSLREKIDTDESAWKKLQAFRTKVQAAHHCASWSSPGELQAQVISGLTETIGKRPAEGWVKANQVLLLRQQVKELQAQLRQARKSLARNPAANKLAQLRKADLKIRSKLPEARREGVRVLIALKDTTRAMERISHGQPYVRAAAAEVLAELRHKNAIRLLISGLHFEGGTRNRTQIIPDVERALAHYGRSALTELMRELPTTFSYGEDRVWISAMANAASDDVQAARILLAKGTKSTQPQFLAAALQTKFVFAKHQVMETISSYVNVVGGDGKAWRQRSVADWLADSPTGATEWARRVVRRWVKDQVAGAGDSLYPPERHMVEVAVRMKAVSEKDLAEFARLTDNTELRSYLLAKIKEVNEAESPGSGRMAAEEKEVELLRILTYWAAKRKGEAK